MTHADEQVTASVHVHTHAVCPAVNNTWKWLVAIGNLLIGLLELVFGYRVSWSLLVDALHNGTDFGTYLVQGKNAIEGNKMGHARLERRRLLSYWAISGVSALLGMIALVGLVRDVDLMPHRMGILAAGSSLLFNITVYLRMRLGTWNMLDVLMHWRAWVDTWRLRASYVETMRDLDRHFIRADIPSAALAVIGVLWQPYFHDAEQVAAILSSIVVVIAFRPTKHNLAH